MSTNLDQIAEGCIGDAIYDQTELDLNSLREAAQDQVYSAAESVTIYYTDCLDIISRYESEAGNDADDLCSGETYTAPDWQKAMVAYAGAVAATVLGQKVSALIDEIEEAAETLEATTDESVRINVSLSCPHGWAAHDTEDHDTGIMLWKARQLDGLNGAAIKAGGIWLSYVTDPNTSEDE